MTKGPTISQVVAQIGKPGIEYGRGLRFVGGYVFTRASKGTEFFISRIKQEKKIVEGFKKEIDDILGKGEGKKMLEGVGVRLGFFDFNPKIDAHQTKQLNEQLNKALEAKPPGLKESTNSLGRRHWEGQFSLKKESTERLTTNLKKHFEVCFNSKKAKDVVSQLAREAATSSILLSDGKHRTDLNNIDSDEMHERISRFVNNDADAADNLSLILVSRITSFVDHAFRDESGLIPNDAAGGATALTIQKQTDQYKITINRTNFIDFLDYCGGDDANFHYELEDDLLRYGSTHEREMTLVISHDDLKKRNAAGLRLDERDPPQSKISCYPKTVAPQT
jgi:hypothetical protein